MEKDNEDNYSNFPMSESSDQDEDSESIPDKGEIEAATVDGENMENEIAGTRGDVSGESDGGDGSFLRSSTKRKKEENIIICEQRLRWSYHFGYYHKYVRFVKATTLTILIKKFT